MGESCDVLLIGASVRALASSALRAGLRPLCVDLFGDVDLARACATRVLPLAEYPLGFVDLVRDVGEMPWMYTGGVENAPRLIDGMPGRLWGVGGDAVRAVRDPWRLAALGLPLPALAASAAEADAARTWLLKPRRSSGGLDIRPWRAAEEFDTRRFYLQEFRDGTPCSAVFIGDAEGTAQYVGASRQIIGAEWLHARPFLYAGSLGPLALTPKVEAEVRRWGDVCVSVFGLRGLFGCDFLADGNEAWLLEVNPRYTASVEILERATGESLLTRHIAAFRSGGERVVHSNTQGYGFAESQAGLASPACVQGKAVLFAREDVRFPDAGPWQASLASPLASLRMQYADIPAAGSVIERGRPVLTCFASGVDDEDCAKQLRETARDLDWRLWGR